MQSENGNDVAHDTRPLDSTQHSSQPPRRVWPVFVAFIVVLGGVLVGSGVLVVALVAWQEGGMPRTSELESRLGAVLLTPPALIASVSLSVFLLLSSSLIGAALSAQPMGERLRLRKQSIPFLAYPVSIVGLLVVGQSLEYVAIWLGFRDGTSALDVLADAVAGMPQTAFAVFLIAGSLGAGLAEELFFRGYMQTRLTARWGVVAGLIVSSIAFAVLHLDPLHATLAFFMGIYLGWLAELGGSILLPIVAHIGNNFLAFVMMRVTENTVEAPIPYFAVSVTLAVVCVLLLRRFVPSTQNAALSTELRSDAL